MNPVLVALLVLAAGPVPVVVKAVSAEVVEATLLTDGPGMRPRAFLIVRAEGEVGSTGWAGARLVEREAETGLRCLEFDLVAERPSGPAAEVRTPISAAKIGEITALRGLFKGVRVLGAGGTVAEAKIKGL